MELFFRCKPAHGKDHDLRQDFVLDLLVCSLHAPVKIVADAAQEVKLANDMARVRKRLLDGQCLCESLVCHHELGHKPLARCCG